MKRHLKSVRGGPVKPSVWVPPENIHLTLRFLGEVEDGLLAALRSGLDEIADDESPFALQLGHTGAFPNLRQPRVIWVGLVDAEEWLLPLQKLVESLVRSQGWECERAKKFSPHLTLGRVRPKSRPPRGEWVVHPPASRFTVEGLSLVRSELKHSGAEYSVLHRAGFHSRGLKSANELV